jgi:hypothetical protein
MLALKDSKFAIVLFPPHLMLMDRGLEPVIHFEDAYFNPFE